MSRRGRNADDPSNPKAEGSVLKQDELGGQERLHGIAIGYGGPTAPNEGDKPPDQRPDARAVGALEGEGGHGSRIDRAQP